MYDWQLPKVDLEATLIIIKALQAEGMVVTRWEWKYIPRVNQFYLLVTTPSIAVFGPPAVIQIQERAMERSGVNIGITNRVRLIAE